MRSLDRHSREKVGNRALELRHHVAEDQGVDLGIAEADFEALPSTDIFATFTGSGFFF